MLNPAIVVGFSRDVLNTLEPRSQKQLQNQSLLWCAMCLALGIAGAFATWIVSPNIFAAILGGLVFALLALNLIRVLHAGGGITSQDHLPTDLSSCEGYLPSLSPSLFFLFLAIVLAQPLQIPLRPELTDCLLYTSPSPRDATLSRMPSSA